MLFIRFDEGTGVDAGVFRSRTSSGSYTMARGGVDSIAPITRRHIAKSDTSHAVLMLSIPRVN